MRHRRFPSTLWRITGLLVISALGLFWRARRRPSAVEPEPFPPVPPRPVTNDPRAAVPEAADDPSAERADGQDPAPTSRPVDSAGGETPLGADPAPTAASPRWVAPDSSGGCPDGFPVKVKLSSGLYHEPGAAAYGRTRPDRCYRDAAAARADGFRPARH